MPISEITELLDIAIDREIASEAFYIGAQKKTQDPGARELLQELASQEAKHREWVKDLKEKGLSRQSWRRKKLPDLMISEYLIDINLEEPVGLQDVITAAMKREQNSIDFYTQMKQLLNVKIAQQLCERLIQEEHRHKSRLEVFYDDFFLKEN